jgi:hypothetical protein
MKRILWSLVVGILIVAGFFSVPISAQAHAKTQAHLKTKDQPKAISASDPEYSPLQPLEGNISQLGEASYASTYSGVQISGDVLNIYVVPANDSAFLSAVADLDTTNLPYTIVDVGESYATEAATSKWIAGNYSTLQSQGINAGWWGSDPEDNAIRIALQTPTSAQMTELQDTATQVLSASVLAQLIPTGTSITLSTYLPVAAAVMNALVPSPGTVVVYPTLLGPGQEASGYDNMKPFYGADEIKYTTDSTETCTSNFSFNGVNHPDNDYVFTATHCSEWVSGHDFYTCATYNDNGNCNYNVGTVASVYSDGADFESILSSNAGYVWNDSDNSYWSVNGYIDADPGDLLTVDGEANGAHYDNYVDEGGGNTCVSYDGHVTCDAIVISTGSNELCIPGDSGGPVLQRESDGYHIYAAGMILAYDDTDDGDFCYAQQVFYIRSTANVDLIWGN